MLMLSICVVTICTCWAYAQSKKYTKRWLSLHIVSCLIEYLGEYRIYTRNHFRLWIRGPDGLFDAKKPPSKISCLGTFKQCVEQGRKYWKLEINAELRQKKEDILCHAIWFFISYVCFHVKLLWFHVNMMLYNCQITYNCGNSLV